MRWNTQVLILPTAYNVDRVEETSRHPSSLVTYICILGGWSKQRPRNLVIHCLKMVLRLQLICAYLSHKCTAVNITRNVFAKFGCITLFYQLKSKILESGYDYRPIKKTKTKELRGRDYRESCTHGWRGSSNLHIIRELICKSLTLLKFVRSRLQTSFWLHRQLVRTFVSILSMTDHI